MSPVENVVDPNASASEQTTSTGGSDAECIRRCEGVVTRYRRDEVTKSDDVLALHQNLLGAPSIKSGADSLSVTLGLYLSMLDEADKSAERAHQQGALPSSQTLSEELTGGNEQSRAEREPQEEEAAGSDKSSEASSDPGDDGSRGTKRRRVHLDVTRFPWHERRETQVASLPEDIKRTFEHIKMYLKDPKRVVEHILSTPGCPPFPPSQWLNLVQWKYVDLAKVLESAHTTELDPKQTHVIDDKVELSFCVSKSTGSIGSATDHNSLCPLLSSVGCNG